jgi:hypothetical protein
VFVVHWLCAVTVRDVAGLGGSRLERTVVQRATQYAKSGRVSIAYQIVGDGPTDLILVPGFVSHVEVAWEEPQLAHFLGPLAWFSRAHRTMRGTAPGGHDTSGWRRARPWLGDVDAIADAVEVFVTGRKSRPRRRTNIGVDALSRRDREVAVLASRGARTWARRWARRPVRHGCVTSSPARGSRPCGA